MEPEDYRKIKLLGEGAFGKAFLVEYYKDQTKWVMKQMDISAMTPKERDETIKEAKILEYLQHPNIVKFKEVYGTKAGKLCIVMEYADGGDLSQKVKDQKGQFFSENQILDWFTQICLAMKHVHDRKILHRDLKGQNIFLTRDNRVKLGDFGIARVLGNTMDKARTQIGTPYYLSPEIIESKPYSYASDVWSLGAVLYEMCTLKPPFLAESLHNLALKIVKGQYTPISQNYSKELKNLVSSLLQVQPSKRPTIHQILKSPVIVKRIKEFLTESVKQVEFAHTILHNKKLQINLNLNQIKMVSEEMLTRPPLLKQTQSEPAKPQAQAVVLECAHQQNQQPQKVPSNQVLKQPINQAQQQNRNNAPQTQAKQQQQQSKQQVQPQKRVEKPIQPSAPSNKAMAPQQVQKVVLQKPSSANKRSTSKNKVVDQYKQEADRARFLKIKEEADKKRQIDEEKIARQKQIEQEQKNRAKEEYTRKRELEQKQMKEDLQRRRMQKNQQSQEQFDNRPLPQSNQDMDLRAPPKLEMQQQQQPSTTNDDRDLDVYITDESSKDEIQHEPEEDDDPQNYGVQFEEDIAQEQIEDAHYILDLEEILADVQDMNDKVKELDQFEMKKKDILESQIPENIRDDDEDLDFDLTLTAKIEPPVKSEPPTMSYFGKPDSLVSLKISLTQILGQENFDRAVDKISAEVYNMYIQVDSSDNIDDIETQNKPDKYQKLLGFISEEDRIKYVHLLFQYTISMKLQQSS